MAETSTVVPGGDLAGRRKVYAQGYLAGAADGLGFIVALSLAVMVCGWLFFDADSRADRAEARLAEIRARGFTGPSARDGDVVMLRWDNGGWRPMSARLPLTGGTITGQNLHFGGAPLMPVSTTPHVVDRFSHTDDDVEVR